MRLFEELKRRNVFRVGVAYAVAAWVILQLTDVVGEILELPAWGGKLILLVIVVGFPITLFAAWAFELTPEGIKRESEVDRSQSITPNTGKKLNNFILILMALAIAYLLVDKFYLSELVIETESVGTAQVAEINAEADPQVASRTDRRSIAVLPFDNRSRLEEDQFFVEGVHDDLLTNLARIGDLKVISRTSVMRYQDTAKSIPEIAAELGVAAVMEGAVQRSGNTVRINVQLIDAGTDEHLWAEIFDRELTADNLFAIQTEISEKIAQELKATLSPAEQQRISDRPTENLPAYQAYMRGRQLMTRRTSEDLEAAAREFERAVELDPEFALAWVGIAEVNNLLTGYSSLAPADALKTMEGAVDRALALNDQLGEAYLSLAQINEFYERWDDAESAYEKALELSPGYATVYHWYGNYLTRYPHRVEEASAMLARAVELDPLSSIIRLSQTGTLVTLGRYEEAERELNRLLELDPEFSPAYSSMAGLKNITGRFDEQVIWLKKALELDPGRVNLYQNMAFAYLDMGDEEALPRLQQAIEEIDEQHWAIGLIDAVRNINDKNFAGAIESLNWISNKIGPVPGFQGFFAYIYMLGGDFDKARQALEIAEPRFFEPSQWRAAIELNAGQGCGVAYVMMRTGDEAMGQDLLNMTISYLENELPAYVDHADAYNQGCYAVAGDIEKALQSLQLNLEHGHIGGWWFWSQLPQMEPLRGDPRFEAIMLAIREKVAAQRANLAGMDDETVL
jgi:TolB-like protein/tetratricopeptide (TPR) repeat protein